MKASAIALLGAIGLLTGCGQLSTTGAIQYEKLGSFGDDGFRHETLPYRVAYLEGGQRLMGEDWTLDNFYDERGERLPKNSDEYLETLEFDLDGDGEIDTRRRMAKADLRFLHRRRSAVIWLGMSPLSDRQRETELRVIAEHYVEAVAGAGYTTVSIGRNRSAVVQDERTYSTRMLDRRPVQTFGDEALEFTFEVASIEQLELSRESRSRIVRIVLARPGFDVFVDGVPYRALVVLGYSAMPEDFDATLPDFEALVNRFEPFPDRNLDTVREGVLACLSKEGMEDRPSLGVEVAVDAAGAIEGVKVDAGSLGARDRVNHWRAVAITGCIEPLLVDRITVAATGSERRVYWTFTRAPRAAPAVARYQSLPLAQAGASAEAAAVQPKVATDAPAMHAAAGTPAMQAAAKDAAPAPPADADGLRARVDAKKADVLACTGTERAVVVLEHAAGELRISLRGDLAGSAEEACVQHALGGLSAPPGEGRIVHLLSTDS